MKKESAVKFFKKWLPTINYIILKHYNSVGNKLILSIIKYKNRDIYRKTLKAPL
jgi:hypothetical protein